VEHREVAIISTPKKLERGKATSKATCEHSDYPTWMTIIGDYYQARCGGCEMLGPAVKDGPWVAEQELYHVGESAA
jgi:hypothetical protein